MSDQSTFLRVLWDDDEAAPRNVLSDRLSAEMTLGQFFWEYAWPDCFAAKGDSKRTCGDYRVSLAYWKKFSGDPPLSKITKRTCSRFLNLLRNVRQASSGQPLAENTVHKHWVNVQRLLVMTGPAGRQNPDGAEILENPPWLKGPGRQHLPPRPAFTLEEIWRCLEALPREARSMPKIAGYDPVDWWRAVILVAYNSAMRPGSLFRFGWEMLNEHCLQLPAQIVKSKRGHLVWLNEAALAALEPLRRSGGLVFGWSNWPEAETTLKKHRLRLEKAAGIRPLSLYALRRSFSTECGKINPLAMQLQMGHVGAGLRMAAEHYISAEAVLADALAKMPQPGRAVQQQLF